MSSGIAIDPDTGALSELPTDAVAVDATISRKGKRRGKDFAPAKGAQKYAQLSRESVVDSDSEP